MGKKIRYNASKKKVRLVRFCFLKALTGAIFNILLCSVLGSNSIFISPKKNNGDSFIGRFEGTPDQKKPLFGFFAGCRKKPIPLILGNFWLLKTWCKIPLFGICLFLKGVFPFWGEKKGGGGWGGSLVPIPPSERKRII